MRIKIGLDVDDVLNNNNLVCIEMANEEYGFDPPLNIQDIDSWENTGRASVIHKYYEDPELYRRQTISEETKKIVRELNNMADVYFITAVYPQFMGERARQLREAFPDIPGDRIILGAAKHLVHFDMVLDDNMCNVLNSPATYPVLMRKPWNTEMTGLLSVNNLTEFLHLVKHILHLDTDEGEKDQVIAVIGPTGSRKNDLADNLCKRFPYEFRRPESYSTVKNNPAYRYMSSDDFKKEDWYEHTVYGGQEYGMKKDAIDRVIENGEIPVLVLDMCGAISLKRDYDVVMVYAKRDKPSLVKAIVSRQDMSDDEKTLRLLALDAERRNRDLCSLVADTTDLPTAVNIVAQQGRRRQL